MLPNPAHLLGQPRFPEVTEAPDHEAAAKTPGDRAIHSRGSQIALGVTATQLAADNWQQTPPLKINQRAARLRAGDQRNEAETLSNGQKPRQADETSKG